MAKLQEFNAGGAMKIEMIKQPGGVFCPASDMEAEKLCRLKTGEQYSITVNAARNPSFHRKVFAFFNFCFEHWAGGNEFQDEQTQFDAFRKQLTILAGYRKEIVNLRTHSVGYEAESLSYGGMDQEEFERCYIALTNAAMKNIFKGADQEAYNKLMSFF
jgi:hypothetical protein